MTPETEGNAGASDASIDAGAAGRGVLSMGAAKGLFVVLGLVVVWAVPRLLGSPAVYGRLTAVTTALAILTNTLTAASHQTISKLTSEREGDASILTRQALRFALALGVVSAGLFAVASPVLADAVFGDPTLAPLFLVGSLVLLGVPVYATGIGVLNGARRFAAQARLDVSYTVMRTAGLVGGAALGVGAIGAAGGFALAVTVMAVVAVAVVGIGQSGGPSRTRELLALFGPIAAYTLAQNGVLQLDVELLKAASAAMMRAEGLGVAIAADLASEHVGLYRTAQSLAFVPYQLSIALTLVVFPLVSKALGTGDVEGARSAARGALRFALLWLVLAEAPLAGAGERAIDLLFPSAFVAGADALPILALSQVFFGVFAVACTILISAGRPWQAFAAALVGVIVVVIATLCGLFLVGAGGPLRVATALGALAGAVSSVTIALALVGRALGPVLPSATFLRAVVAGTAAFAAARAVPLEGALGAIVSLAAGALACIATFALLGERPTLRPPGPRAKAGAA